MATIPQLIEKLRKQIRAATPISGAGIICTPTAAGVEIHKAQEPRPLGGSGDSSVLLHPFKIWTRVNGSDFQYAVAEQHPDTASVIAGLLYAPNGVKQDVAAKAWTTITATTAIYLSLSVNEGAITPSWVTSAPTIAVADDPAILGYHIGTLTLASGAWALVQKQVGTIDLSGAVIPAWYAGYNKSSIDQILVHLKNAAPSWFVTDTQTYERIPHWGTDNTLQTLDAQTASTHAFVMSTSSSFTQIVAKDCAGTAA